MVFTISLLLKIINKLSIVVYLIVFSFLLFVFPKANACLTYVLVCSLPMYSKASQSNYQSMIMRKIIMQSIISYFSLETSPLETAILLSGLSVPWPNAQSSLLWITPVLSALATVCSELVCLLSYTITVMQDTLWLLPVSSHLFPYFCAYFSFLYLPPSYVF